jgi:hypothetical protein
VPNLERPTSALHIRFRKMEQTCNACPSQWDAWDADGVLYYIRYRWGHLTIHRGGVDGDLIFEWQSEDCWEGILSTEDMLEKTGCTLVPSELFQIPY